MISCGTAFLVIVAASRRGIDANTARWFGGDLIPVAVSGARRIGCCTSALVGHHRGLGGVELLVPVLSYSAGRRHRPGQ
jgi:hypothetical protein